MRQNSNQFAVPDVILSTMTGIMGFKEVALPWWVREYLRTPSDFFTEGGIGMLGLYEPERLLQSKNNNISLFLYIGRLPLLISS